MEGDAERWARVREVLNHALELPTDQRPAYLDTACRGDASLRAEIESLIAASEGTAWIDRPILSSSLNTATLELASMAAGQRIGPYQVMEKLGQGGMGVVYKAVDTRLDRIVALKVLSRPDGSATDRSRFLREAKAASALNHPNIVTIYEYDSVDSLDFIAMEFIPGATLHQMLAQGSTPLDSLLEFARQVASALAKAHAAGIVHRDLKPNNIMVTEGIAKVLDFGLAKRETSAPSYIDATETQALTRVGAIVGTPAYMSPEQAMGEPADYRSDIFSFGIILYEMACGRRPFQGSNPQATLHQIASVDPPAVSEVNRSVPRDLARLIERCLKKKKEERLQSMAAVAEELAAMVQPRAPSTASSRRRMLAAGVLVVAGLAAGVWYSRKPAPSRERGLICSLEAQQLRDGQPVGEPHMVSAGEAFQGGWRFRLRAQSPQPGYLYLIDEGPDQAGAEQLVVLYPGTAGTPLPPNRPALTPWYRIEGAAGTERLWIVWAKEPVNELEGSIHGGTGGRVVDSDLTGKIRDLLAGLISAHRPSEGEPAGTINLRGSALVLGAMLELRHQ